MLKWRYCEFIQKKIHLSSIAPHVNSQLTFNCSKSAIEILEKKTKEFMEKNNLMVFGLCQRSFRRPNKDFCEKSFLGGRYGSVALH